MVNTFVLHYYGLLYEWKSNAELCEIGEKSVLIPINYESFIFIPVNWTAELPKTIGHVCSYFGNKARIF